MAGTVTGQVRNGRVSPEDVSSECETKWDAPTPQRTRGREEFLL
jgi:hypothetical protein